ncbi:putative metal-dependent HD superfamily phosphohydrolase [Dyadobacter sp. BE34]|uniref:Metal-dependent HD superfamily phosphohydrolase n=1 Tax=Dyadobacter fermentans TaxID=94254 RepID=A0ABU1R1L9_9BACT|nr:MULTISPECIES: Pycsar system effector family protein [Dyadobacter]MDR6807298.1 putative metal-dependent HD superfamily phosphohydrolase [Dyadobacter fermentans]MDR7045039.1 putative metal-dependent HD superfamily phosphohydrolase [Dyadobacter sp. BE242]MDR7199225.1 putative metal-dependent HD superfamily phosphohydrolase [Dyadobacter sp. BE34]MDR7217185.1 putative metal-dependent HD superfamily phosphohydrolase [Dyadobacter sp. BE31]MDR7265118.1 putative metal-dependent HD superfamily phosph
MNYNHRLDKVKHHVHHFFGTKALAQLSYHNLVHTESVVGNAVKIANHYRLEDKETFIVVTAAWFHDTGYSTGEAAGHEKRGAAMAAEFLRSEEVEEEVIAEVEGCILATVWPQKPTNFLQQVVCDADLYHLGTPEFGDWNKLVRKEAEQRLGRKIDKAEWRKSTIKLLENHEYQTDYCRDLLDKQKKKNLEKLKQKLLEDALEEAAAQESQQRGTSATPATEPPATSPATSTVADLPVIKHHKETFIPEITEGKKKKDDRPDKGIETMFRISSNNHQRLSDMADNKAHIMITTTSIIISVLLSVLVRKLEDNAYLIIPTMMLLTVCMVTMVFSILSTRPTIPRGTFTQDDIDAKSVNLLFFGNFYRMSFNEYSKGMQTMMNDRDFLYGSLTKDVYSQGVVLGRKYRLLRVAYNVFMFGIVISVVAFVIASIFFEH